MRHGFTYRGSPSTFFKRITLGDRHIKSQMILAWCSTVVVGLLLIALASAGPLQLASVVEVPEVVGGPVSNMFDSPFLALLKHDNSTVGYTANSVSYLWSNGSDINAVLAVADDTGLGPDGANTSYSHCGKWLNAAWVDESDVIHGYFHQEWHCDYADGLYTNKSVGYARSVDGGRTFVPFPQPSESNPAANQIRAGSNFTSTHQTGEGDHQTLQVGHICGRCKRMS